MNKSQNYIYFNSGQEHLLLNIIEKENYFSFNPEKDEDNSFYLNSFNSLSYLGLSNNSSSFDEKNQIDNNINNKNLNNNLFPKTKTHFRIEKQIPNPISEKEINIKIKQMGLNKENKIKYLLDIYTDNNEIIKINEKLMKNQNERRNKKRKKKEDKNTINKSKTKYGRKNNKDNTIRILSHDKFYQDNIIDKIKNMLNNSLISFCNRLIYSIYTNEEQIKQIFKKANISHKNWDIKIIKQIKYDFISNKKKGKDIINLLNMTIKDYLSNKISPKYTEFPLEYNTLIIKQLLLDDNNKDIFDFIFNHLKIEDWLNIFIYQKKFKDFVKYESLSGNKKNKIKESFIGIDVYFDKIYKSGDKKGKIYFHCFMLMIYNFVRFIMIRESRNTEKSE